MFGGDDEDGDFLSPSGGAKLASLFGLDQESSRGNESFQYTAPKQPRKTSNSASQKPAPPAGAPAVVLATAVQTFRYINGQYVKQGKLGAAVLGNHTAKEYKLLLYLSQQKQVAAAKIHAGFVFTVQPNNYCTFYDDQRQNWSLMFESEKSSSDFCKEVCLAKANCVASLDVAVVQDLSLGEGQAVENGDSLEVVYTGWLLQNHAVGQVFDSNQNQNKDKLLRLRVGAGKVIRGWEEGMLGMKKAGRRFIVIPPNLAYGTKGVPNRIPSNSTLIFEAELRRVKFAKDSGSDRASASSRDSAAPSPAPSVENLTPEPPVQTSTSGPGTPGETPLRAKSNSLSEQLANPDATKAKLISRMARMGQPMLPFLTGAAGQHESSDSELEDTSASRGKDQPVTPSPVQISTSSAPAAAHVHPHPHAAPPSALLPVMTAQPGLPGSSHAFQPYAYAQTSLAPSQLQPVGPVYPAQTVPYMGPSDVTSFLMTEARQHNTEIRLSVGKVGDKVDQLASKIEELQRQGGLSMGVSSMSMETSMMVHNIQRIVQENECLKKEVFEKSSRIEEQNHKIGELINQNQRFMEQSNLQQEKRNDSLKSSSEQNQARLLQAELDKNALPQDPGSGQVQLTEELASSTSRLAQLQLEASTQQQKAMELQTKLSSALQDIENHSQRIAGLEKQLEEVKEVAERTQTQYRSEKQRRKEMELRLSNMEEEVQDLKTDKDRLERTLSDRKRKWQAERQRRDEEVEELRRSSQQELDNVRAQLRKARTNTDNAASEQLSQLQVELEEEWKGRSEQMLASAKEKHIRELAELTEQRDALQDQLTQLQEKITAVKHSRDSEEQLQHHRQTEELQALQQKYSALGRQAAAGREELERRVAELETKRSDQEGPGDTAAEVKRVMNGVFHSLRGEFDLGESYSGQTVLAVIVTTIKNVTLQLLSGADGSSQRRSKNGEEELEERDEVTQKETMRQRIEHVNGETDVREEEAESHRVAETQMFQKQTETGTTATTDPHPFSSTHLEPQETPTSGSEEERSVPETSTEEEESNKTVCPDTEPGESPAPETGLETSPPQQTGQEMGPPQETGQETSPPQQTGQETGPTQQTGQETGPPQQIGQETGPPQQTGQEMGPPQETGQETSPPQETGQETSPPKETGQETSPTQETGQGTSPPQETRQETSPPKENGQETSPLEETGQETSPPQETGQETSPPQETGQETSPPQETGQETSPPPESGQITASATVAAVSSEADGEVVDDGEHAGKQEAAPPESFGPPANPPPPPNVLHSSSGGETSLTGGMREENGEEPFFKIPTPAKPPAAPSEEEDEDEMSLKGRPPPTPLFGDDEDDDDLDWLN